MSQKLALTLIIAGLVAHACASVNWTAPGFSFTSQKSNHHDTLNISAADGILTFPILFCNVSAWNFHPGNGTSTITQNTSVPYLTAKYNQVHASVDDVTVVGKLLRANSDKTTFKVSLAASGSDTRCKLEGRFSSPQMGIRLEMEGFGAVGSAFKAPAVLRELEAAVWGALGDALTVFLTDWFAQALPGIDDEDALCRQILAARPEEFPAPHFNYRRTERFCARIFS